MNPADVFAGSRLGVTTAARIVKEQQLSMCWSCLHIAREASHPLGLIGLQWLSTSYPDQLAFEVIRLSPCGVKG